MTGHLVDDLVVGPDGLSRCGWGTSTADYDPHHWKYVAKGSCEGMKTPSGHGVLTPM